MQNLIGKTYSFDYPRSNNIDAPEVYRRRTIIVSSVRDLSKIGHNADAIAKRPKKRRGRWLVTGICLDTRSRRSFYVESMRHSRQETWLTLGLYDATSEDTEPVYRLGCFAPVVGERRFLVDVMRAYREESDNRDLGHCLGVFPVNGQEESAA